MSLAAICEQVQEEERTQRGAYEAELTTKLQEVEAAANVEKKMLEKQTTSLAEQLMLLQQKLQIAEEASFIACFAPFSGLEKDM